MNEVIMKIREIAKGLNLSVFNISILVWKLLTDEKYTEDLKALNAKSERQTIQAILDKAGVQSGIRSVQYFIACFHMLEDNKVTLPFDQIEISRFTKIQPIINMIESTRPSDLTFKPKDFKELVRLSISRLLWHLDARLTKDLYVSCMESTKALFSKSDKAKREEKEDARAEKEQKALEVLARSEEYSDMFHVQKDKDGNIVNVSAKYKPIQTAEDVLQALFTLPQSEKDNFLDKFLALNDIAENRDEKEVNRLRAEVVKQRVTIKDLNRKILRFKSKYNKNLQESHLASIDSILKSFNADKENKDFENTVGFSIS